MQCMFAIKRTVLFKLHFLRFCFFVSSCTVILALTFRALKMNDISHFF